jgi:Protein of unknown function (DUF1488)
MAQPESLTLDGDVICGGMAAQSHGNTPVALHFPNASRYYNLTQRCVCFWGHDSAFEISFHLDEDALFRMSPHAERDEASLLHVFDVNSARIHETARVAYSQQLQKLLSHIGVGFGGTGPSCRKTRLEVTNTVIKAPRSRDAVSARGNSAPAPCHLFDTPLKRGVCAHLAGAASPSLLYREESAARAELWTGGSAVSISGRRRAALAFAKSKAQ